MPYKLPPDHAIEDWPESALPALSGPQPQPKPKEEVLSDLIGAFDEDTIAIALVAMNPDLEDILPEDSHLKRDVSDIRRKIADRMLTLEDNPREIHSVVQRHVHLHLWDQHTSDRIKALGKSIVGMFKNVKTQLIDNDNRNTMTVGEAVQSFRDSFRGAKHFVGGLLTSPVDKAAAEEVLEEIAPETREAAIRLASAAVGDLLDANLETIADQAAGASYQMEIQVFPMITLENGDARLINSDTDQNEKADFYDIGLYVRDEISGEHIHDHPLYREWDGLKRDEALDVAKALQILHPEMAFEWLEENEPDLTMDVESSAVAAQAPATPEPPAKKPFKLMSMPDGPDM